MIIIVDPRPKPIIQRFWIAVNCFFGKLERLVIQTKFVMPKLKPDEEIHIILEVRDDGRPALYSYRRIVVRQ